MRRSHRLEGMPQTSSFAGLAAGEEAARSAMACEHRGRGVGPSWACGALSKLLRVYLTPSAPLVGPAHSCMSGREIFEGNHERMGAHVIENAKLAQPPPARAGPSLRNSGFSGAGPHPQRPGARLAASLGGAPSDVFTYALITDAETQP